MIIGTAGSAHDLCLHSLGSHSSQPCDSSKHFSLAALTCSHWVYCLENGRRPAVCALNHFGQFSFPPAAILKNIPKCLAEHATRIPFPYQGSLCIQHRDIQEHKVVQILDYYPHLFFFILSVPIPCAFVLCREASSSKRSYRTKLQNEVSTALCLE